VSFQNFDDKETCRIESANIYHIEFAADWQPYQFFPTIYCFDANGDSLSGYQTSTINVRCNDVAGTPPIASVPTTTTTEGGREKGNAGLAFGVIAFLVITFAGLFFVYNRYKERIHSYMNPGGNDNVKSPPSDDDVESSMHSRSQLSIRWPRRQQQQQQYDSDQDDDLSSVDQQSIVESVDEFEDDEQPSSLSNFKSSSHHTRPKLTRGLSNSIHSMRSQWKESSRAFKESSHALKEGLFDWLDGK
jgi:hypothetical protein